MGRPTRSPSFMGHAPSFTSQPTIVGPAIQQQQKQQQQAIREIEAAIQRAANEAGYPAEDQLLQTSSVGLVNPSPHCFMPSSKSTLPPANVQSLSNFFPRQGICSEFDVILYHSFIPIFYSVFQVPLNKSV